HGAQARAEAVFPAHRLHGARAVHAAQERVGETPGARDRAGGLGHAPQDHAVAPEGETDAESVRRTRSSSRGPAAAAARCGGRGAAARDRAGALPGGRAAPQEAAGAGTADARSARGGAQEAGAGGSAQAVPVQQTLTVGRCPSSVTENGPRITDDETTRRSIRCRVPAGWHPEMTAAADQNPREGVHGAASVAGSA